MPIVSTTKSFNRCSYCHNRGHNKSTCPAYKARIEEWRAEYGDEHPWVAKYDMKKAKRADLASALTVLSKVILVVLARL